MILKNRYVIRCNGNTAYVTACKDSYYDHNSSLWSTLSHATIYTISQANLMIEDLKPWICSVHSYQEEVDKLVVKKIMEF